jgi:hypothetical protein
MNTYAEFVKKYGDRPKDIIFAVATADAYSDGRAEGKAEVAEVAKEIFAELLKACPHFHVIREKRQCFRCASELKAKYLGEVK